MARGDKEERIFVRKTEKQRERERERERDRQTDRQTDRDRKRRKRRRIFLFSLFNFISLCIHFSHLL